jgi:hypothetical protein
LGYLSQKYKNNPIICYTDTWTIINARTTALSYDMVNIMVDSINTKKHYKKTDFLRGLNIFDTPNFLILLKMGKFDRVKKPFLFTDKSTEAKKMLNWSILPEISPKENMDNILAFDKAYCDLEAGGPNHPESLYYMYAKFHRVVENLDKPIIGIGRKKEDYSYGDIAYSLYLIESWINQK